MMRYRDCLRPGLDWQSQERTNFETWSRCIKIEVVHTELREFHICDTKSKRIASRCSLHTDLLHWGIEYCFMIG